MSDYRLLPLGSANERDVADLEGYIRKTIWKAMPQVTDTDELTDLVAQGFLIAEEIQAKTGLGESFRQALAARLANRLRDYWRLQHPEYRRRGDGTATMLLSPTGLAYEGAIGAGAAGLGAANEMDAVYTRLKLEELEGVTSPRDLMSDPRKAGLLFGVASWRLTPARAEWAFETLQDLRLEHRPQTRFGYSNKPF
jgi:hypothetical protein